MSVKSLTTATLLFSALFSATTCFGATLADTRLLDAVKAENLSAVRAAIAQGASIAATDPDGSTALHWAAQRDNDAIVAALIAAGAKVDANTRFSITPLSLAAMNGNAKIMARLLDAGADVNSTSSEGQTILMTAALNGNPEAVKLAIQRGAKVNTIEPYKGQTATMWAAGEGNAKAIELLVEFGADVKLKSKGGYTAFHFAVRNRQMEAAKVLLAHGALVNETIPDGTGPLNMAIVNGYFDVASMLLDAGADPNQADARGSALHSLTWMRKPGAPWEAAALAEDPEGPPKQSGNVTALELAKKLLEKGANPNKRLEWKEGRFGKSSGTTKAPAGIPLGRHFLSFNGSTPFYNAARNGDAPLMKLLVQFGADPKIPNAQGVTPLMAAACLDFYEGETPGPTTGVPEPERLAAVKLALELGNDINAVTDFGTYELVGDPEFLLKGYPTNFDQLQDLGVGDPRFNKMTALYGAILSHQDSILQFLIDSGAKLNVKNQAGWTPLMMTKGVFLANSFKEFPVAGKMLRDAMAKQGIPVE
ncbi:MAG: ankyrin repeat domain-containing protein [Acidobacteriota bacterium]